MIRSVLGPGRIRERIVGTKHMMEGDPRPSLVRVVLLHLKSTQQSHTSALLLEISFQRGNVRLGWLVHDCGKLEVMVCGTYLGLHLSNLQDYSWNRIHLVVGWFPVLGTDSHVTWRVKKITLTFLEGFDIYVFYFLHQQLRKLVLEIIHRIPTNEHLRPHTKNVLSVMFRFLEVIFENSYYLAIFRLSVVFFL